MKGLTCSSVLLAFEKTEGRCLPELNLETIESRFFEKFTYDARNDDKPAQTVADKVNGMIHEDDSVYR